MGLTYYYSPGSRYSYLSLSQMPSIEKEFGVSFDWVPVNGKRIRDLRGADPFAGPALSGQYEWSYRQQDAEAWADLYEIPFLEPETVEFDVDLLCRAVLAADEQGAIRSFSWEIASAVFGRGTWPLDRDAVLAVARNQSLDLSQFVASLEDAGTERRLAQNCEAAVERGAFGTPTVFVGDQIFWGNDRLPLVRHALSKMSA